MGPIQHGWCPYKKGILGLRYTWSVDHMRIEGEGGCQQAGERSLVRNQPCRNILNLNFQHPEFEKKKKCYWLSPPVCGTLLQRPSKLTGLTDWTFDNCQFTTVHQNYLSHCILIFRLTNFFKSPWKFLFLCPNVLCSRTRKDQTGVESWNCRETVLPVTFESLKFLTL